MKRQFKFLTIPAVLFGALFLLANGSGYFEISKNLDIFISLYKKVDELYVDEIDHSKVMRKGIDAMLSELDPYTVYFSESEVEDFRFQRTGTYAGIGARIVSHDKTLVIDEIYENGPAQKAGLVAGDIMLEIDGKSLEGKSVREMSEILKGEENTLVKIRYSRNGVEKEIEFKRDEVKVDNVSYYGMLTNDVGYVKFENFRMDAAKEVKEKMEELKKEGMTKFVLDMRGNPGGLLKEAVDIVNLFVDANNLVVSTKGKNKNHSREYKTYKRPYDKEIPIAVLVDGGSASASEIVSGSIQDYDRGVVLGRNSFGKGLVQITQSLTYNAQIKVTTSKYYTASGRCIQRLDYAARDIDGNVPAVPDSLITEFKTKAGRTVFDGAGVNPDIEIKEKPRSPFVRGLINEYLIFDYVTNYYFQHKTISSPSEFSVSDANLVEFKDFIEASDFTYKTKTEKKLGQLKNSLAGKDSLAVAEEIDELSSFLDALKSDDFESDKEEIREILRLEILERYYYRKGRAEGALGNDNDVKKAIAVLNNPTVYANTLKP
ncbi:MAG: S41 family peptidase [Bacteroidia bacterium]